MDELAIIESLSNEMDKMMLESLSPAEERLRNAIGCILAILRKQYTPSQPSAE